MTRDDVIRRLREIGEATGEPGPPFLVRTLLEHPERDVAAVLLDGVEVLADTVATMKRLAADRARLDAETRKLFADAGLDDPEGT